MAGRKVRRIDFNPMCALANVDPRRSFTNKEGRLARSQNFINSVPILSGRKDSHTYCRNLKFWLYKDFAFGSTCVGVVILAPGSYH